MKRSFTIGSIGAHSIVIAAALFAQILADGTLPTPHRAILFDSPQIMPIVVHPPPATRPAAARTDSPDAAPIRAPEGVLPEPEHPPADPVPSIPGFMSGIDGGIQSAIDSVGASAALPPPPPEPARPVRVGSGIRMPVKVVDVAPVYPAIARTAHVQGVVILEAVLDAQGAVESARVLRSVPLLDQAALDAVRQWRYTPTQLNGRPVPVIITVTVNFMLQDR